MHGAEVVVVTAPGEHSGVQADAAVTAVAGCALAVRTADCAPVSIFGDHSIAIAHAGWRGLLAGVLPATVDALRSLGDTPRLATLGPCIRVGCYEFAGPEREALAARFGPSVLGTTDWGTPALDLPAAVSAALGELGIEFVDDGVCTACDETLYSHRARAEAERFATVVWIEQRPRLGGAGVGE